MLGAGTYCLFSYFKFFEPLVSMLHLFLKCSLIFKSYLQLTGKQVYKIYASKDYIGFYLAHTIS